jgi:DNA polymerase
MILQYISIDLETFSDVDLQKCGVYKYVQSPNFEILLFGYSVDGGEVEVVDLACGEQIPMEIIEALTDDTVTKWAFNAAFERVCLSSYLRRNYPQYFQSYSINEDTVGDYLDPTSWKCSCVWSAYMGLPLSLAGAGAVLGLEEQKLKEGKDLIRYFCVPCKPTKVNGGRTRNLPEHDTEKWTLFKFYNKRDVEVEMSIQEKMKKYPVPDFVWEEYHLDQEINDRGIALDMAVVENAIAFDEKSKTELAEKMQELTNLDNPNSVMQMKQWLADNGLEMESLGKKAVAQAVKTAPAELAEVLVLRQQLSKSSVKKYQAMQNAVCVDSRARGMFRFYGANRSGRWAGRMIQLQNLPQNHMLDLEQARGLVESGNYDAMELLYDDIPDTLSQLIRTAFVPRTGYKFVVADFSAIEARVLSFLAGEQWRMEVFANNGDIYCASASAMFGVPVEKHGVNGPLRQKGKQAELACGYGGSVGALKAMGALEMGLAEEELQPLVDFWRAANPNIVRFWWDVDRCVKYTVKNRVSTETHGIRFIYQSGMLFIQLPSGRRLAYVKPRMGENRFGGEAVTYEGVGGTKKWERIESYGTKFVENIVQAVSRDILAYAMRTLSHCFICGHIHDELIIECSEGVSIDEVCEQMGRTPPWIPGLLLRADGYECSFYQKD